MSDSVKKNNFTDVSAAVIRDFLLGRLDSAKQARFEERLIVDDQLDLRLRLAEIELADEFVLDRMNRIDRKRFRKTFVVTNERRQMLIVSAGLRERLSKSHATQSKSWNPLSLSLSVLRFNRIAWRVAFGVLVLLAVLASAWLVTKEPELVKRILPKRAPARPAASATPQPAHHPADSTDPMHRETPSPLPAHESTSPNVGASAADSVTLVLSPANKFSEAATVSLPSSPAGVVHFKLVFAAEKAEAFQAEIVTVDGRLVFSTAALEIDGGSIVFDVPGSSLAAGDYQIRLSRPHEGSKQAANYYFRVR